MSVSPSRSAESANGVIVRSSHLDRGMVKIVLEHGPVSITTFLPVEQVAFLFAPHPGAQERAA